MNKAKELKILWGIILLYLVFFTAFTGFRHYNFHTQTWDMGIFTQTLWNSAHGHLMQNTLEELPNHLGIHMSPLLFLLVPIYALFPSPYILLAVQTIFLALGAIPLYFLAKKILKRDIWPLILAAGYLFYPSLHWVNIYDFHPIAFLIPFLLAAFYFIEIEKWSWAAAFLALSALSKEDAIIIVAFAGLYLAVKSYLAKNKAGLKFGIWTLALSALYFIITVKLLMPLFGGGLLRIDRYQHLGGNFWEIFKNLFLQPELFIKTIFSAAKLRYLLWLFLPLAFLPIFSGAALILIIPGLAENILTGFSSQFSSFYQYDSVLIAGIFIAAIYGLKNILNLWPKWTPKIKWALIAAIAVGFMVRSPINPVFFPIDVFQSNPRAKAFREIIKLVPENASVSAHTNAVPHLAHREYIYLLGTEPEPVDIVIIDAEDGFGFPDNQSFQNYFDFYANSGGYNLTPADNRFLFISKK